MASKKKIIIASDLKGYFYNSLSEVNSKQGIQFPKEVLHYTSEVLAKFLESEKYFHQTDEGKVKEKVLGQKYLKAIGSENDVSKHEIKDIGETSLVLCGVFYESINPKIVDISYYYGLGKSAYSKMDKYFPSYFDIEGFYRLFAQSFESITNLIGHATSNFEKPFNPFEFDSTKIKTVS